MTDHERDVEYTEALCALNSLNIALARLARDGGPTSAAAKALRTIPAVANRLTDVRIELNARAEVNA